MHSSDEKECKSCRTAKPLSDFSPSKKNRDGRVSYCRACMRVRNRQRREATAPLPPKRPADVPAGHKWCPSCSSVLSIDEFCRNRSSRDGYAAYCKTCHNAIGKRNRERLHGSTRNYHLKRRYGISAAEYDERKAAQDGLCALCREREAEHVDHDHKTGEIRGLLCSCCNQGLGNFRDDPRFLRAAADYVERRQRWRCVQRGVYQLVPPRTD